MNPRLSAEQMIRMARLLDDELPEDPAGRRAWLDRLGARDADLRPALAVALFADAPGGVPADLSLPRILGRTDDAPGHVPGERVGPYELLGRLGAGGMAEVWLAHRADGSLRREVALKLPAVGGLRGDIAERFDQERDILAALAHPNIARLYDAGVSPAGQPYLAMEYVEGARPITAWCDEHCLGLRERLALFLQVLDAVRYAHASHVLHRDLKPSNILVTGQGQVRLLDFGVASLLGQERRTGGEGPAPVRGLTPEYASPEERAGDEVDERCDVYSLGVVLHELLTGSRPGDLHPPPSRGLMGLAGARDPAARASESVRPEAAAARRLAPAQLARALRGDLDLLLERALAQDRARRFPGPEAFARAIERHLDGALPEAGLLRGRSGYWRNRHRLVAAGLGALLAATALVGIRWVGKAPAPPPALEAETSIAVLPFEDLSADQDQRYFVDGLAEELIDRLSHGARLRVVSRASSFRFRGTEPDPRAVAASLGVDHLLEGSVRHAAHSLVVAVRLVRAADGITVWSQSFERGEGEAFRLQDEIAGAAARSLRVALSRDEFLRSGGTRSAEAYNRLLQANFLVHQRREQETARAITLYREALALDPDYAAAWCRLGEAYLTQIGFSWAPFLDSGRLARGALQHALDIDPDFAQAHFAMGQLHRKIDWDWTKAADEYRRTIELDPQDLGARSALAVIDLQHGRPAEHLRLREQMLERDPLDADAMGYLGWARYYAGQYREAADTFRRLADFAPQHATGQAMLAYTMVLAGESTDDALQVIHRESSARARDELLPIIYWKIGRRQEARQALEFLKSAYPSGSSYNIAINYVIFGDYDSAFLWLERARTERDPAILWLRVEPILAPLRTDPRFQALVRKLHLGEAE